MSNRTVVEERGGPAGRWWLPVLLALLIAAIIAGVLLARNKHLFGGSPTATPRVINVTATSLPPTGTPKPGPTSTPRPGPTSTSRPASTGTPRPGPTGTPRPGPTATSHPAATATAHPAATHAAAGVKTGTVTYSQSQLQTIQQGATAKNAAYTPYLNPFQALQKELPSYGFTGAFTIVSPQPPPAATPTASTNSQGQPQIQFVVQYAGHKYRVTLVQPLQHGPSGIWVVTDITQIS